MALRKCAKCGENKIDWNDKKSFGFIGGDVVCGECSGKHKSTVSQQTQKEAQDLPIEFRFKAILFRASGSPDHPTIELGRDGEDGTTEWLPVRQPHSMVVQKAKEVLKGMVDWRLRSPLRRVQEALMVALYEKGSSPVAQKGPKTLTVPSTADTVGGRNPFAQQAAQRKGGTMKNPKDKRKDSNKNWRRHMESAEAPEVGWGEVYGGEPYISAKDGPVWLFKKGGKFQWFNAQGMTLGPEHSGIEGAFALATARGWAQPGGDAGLEPIQKEGAPRFRR